MVQKQDAHGPKFIGGRGRLYCFRLETDLLRLASRIYDACSSASYGVHWCAGQHYTVAEKPTKMLLNHRVAGSDEKKKVSIVVTGNHHEITSLRVFLDHR